MKEFEIEDNKKFWTLLIGLAAIDQVVYEAVMII